MRLPRSCPCPGEPGSEGGWGSVAYSSLQTAKAVAQFPLSSAGFPLSSLVSQGITISQVLEALDIVFSNILLQGRAFMAGFSGP